MRFPLQRNSVDMECLENKVTIDIRNLRHVIVLCFQIELDIRHLVYETGRHWYWGDSRDEI